MMPPLWAPSSNFVVVASYVEADRGQRGADNRSYDRGGYNRGAPPPSRGDYRGGAPPPPPGGPTDAGRRGPEPTRAADPPR